MTKLNYNEDVRYEDYLIQFLKKISSIDSSHYEIVLKAFSKTIKKLVFSGTEFVVENFFSFSIVERKARLVNDGAKKTYGEKLRPALKDFRLKVEKGLKQYLNGRNRYVNTRHRQTLPDGTPRKDDKFVLEKDKIWHQ